MQNDIPYIAYEAAQARSERCIRRLIILCLVLVSMLFASNLAWLLFIDQYEVVGETSIEAEQDGSGVNVIGGGNVSYGAESEDNPHILSTTQDGQ